MDTEKVLDLAQRIHKRRLFVAPDTPKALATGEAMLNFVYDLKLDLDSYDDAMNLTVRDSSNRKVTAVASSSPPYRLSPDLVAGYDIIVFIEGSGFEDAEILGWLPDASIVQAPRHPVTQTKWELEVHPDFLFPMPEEFSFTEPYLEDVPKVWDYDRTGWWTPMGFYVYDNVARQEIARLDNELTG